jgi:uncharacterized membrane protein YdbT with pleckstrin-like domain
MTNLKAYLDNSEYIEYKFRPSRIAFITEYVLFIFVILLSFTSLFPLLISQFKNVAIIVGIAKIIFYILLVISIILLIKVEYKIWSKVYALTNHRIIISEGIFTEKITSVAYNKITDLSLEQTFLNKIFNIGKINIDTAGGDQIEEILENISSPILVKKKISDLQLVTNNSIIRSQNNLSSRQAIKINHKFKN